MLFFKNVSSKKARNTNRPNWKGQNRFCKICGNHNEDSAILVFIAGLVSIFLETGHSLTAIRVMGAIISVGGTVIFIVAVWTMRDSWRAGVSKTDKTELITNGIYHISRNPAFLGFDLLYIGTLLMFFNWILCFLTVFAVTMYHLQIVNVEEDFLLATFGNEYLKYKKKVCRYIGRRR